MRWLALIVLALSALTCRAQVAVDSLMTPDHWVAVDLKEWAWYLNFTREQKIAVRAIDVRCAEREAVLDQGADYVDTETQRADRRNVVASCTAEVQAALDPARFARWLDLRNGARPVKPTPMGPGFGFGIGF